MEFPGFLNRVRGRELLIESGHLSQFPVIPVQQSNLFFGHVFDTNQPVACAIEGRHDLIELEVDCQRILILASLNEEYHQEGGYVSPSVDDELPGVGETEDGSRSCPNDRYAQRNNKGPCAAGPFRDLIRKPFQRTADPARSPLCHNVVLPPFTIVRSEAGLQGWSSQ